MNTVIWIIQIVVGLMFFVAGIMKLTQPIDKLQERMSWVESINPRSLVRVIGAIEMLGALGVILPAATGMLPILTPIAAAGLVLTMISAIVLHTVRHDALAKVAPSIVLLILAAIVVYGRFVAVPLT